MPSPSTSAKAARFCLDVARGRRPLSDLRPIIEYRRSMKKPLVHLEITSRCNTVCRCCTRDASVVGIPLNLNMQISEIMRILEPYQPTAIKGIALSGSESLLHPEFFEIVEAIAERFPAEQLELYTNGIALASDEHVLERVARVGFGGITFSLHGATQDTLSMLMPGVTLEGSIAAARYLAQNSESLLWATFVIQEENHTEIAEFVELIGTSGFHGLSFVPFNRSDVVSGWHDYESEWLGWDLWNRLGAAKRRAEELGLIYSSTADLCSCALPMDIYRADGSMYLCPGVSRPDTVIGNIFRDDLASLRVKRDRAIKHALRDIQRDEVPLMCQSCALRVQQRLP